MLIKRVEKEKTIDCLYESSNILASSYDKKTHDLIITFNRGAQYVYKNVKNSDYLRLEISGSQGEVFNQYIKTYPFVKGDEVNPSMLINEIETYAPKILSEYDKNFVYTIKNIIKAIESNSEIKDRNISDIKKAIDVLNISKENNENKNK